MTTTGSDAKGPGRRRRHVCKTDSPDRVAMHVALVHRALDEADEGGQFPGDPLTAEQIVEALRAMHAGGTDRNGLVDALRAIVGHDVHRAAAVWHAAWQTGAQVPAGTALLAAVGHADEDAAAATAEQYRQAASLLALAAEQRHDREQHATELVDAALSLADGDEETAANSLAVAAMLTVGSTYMVLADAVAQLITHPLLGPL